MRFDEKSCPQCRETISRAAHLCKFCGKRFDQEKIAAEEAVDEKARQRRASGYVLAGGLLMALLVYSAWQIPARKSAEPTAAPSGVISASDTLTPVVAPSTAIAACKAAIGVIMGRDPKTMSGQIIDGGLAHVSYRRSDDGKRWQARCRIDDQSHLTWAAFDAFGDGKQGRWRDEDQISFTSDGKTMRVTYSASGEQMGEKSYPLSKLID